MVGLITLKIKTQMKKFAKYLSVEGEIEVPCIVLETLTNGKTELFQVDNFNDINLETQKLAKLFLCSRDNNLAQEILTEGIKEGQEFSEKEKDFLTLGSVVEI